MPASEERIENLPPWRFVPLESIADKVRWDSEKLYEIMDSIKTLGFQAELGSVPLTAIEYEDNFYIYDGHKRIFSALVAGLESVPVLIVPADAILAAGKGRAVQEVFAGYSPGKFYDWQDAVNYNRRQNGLEPVDWAVCAGNVPPRPFVSKQGRPPAPPSAS